MKFNFENNLKKYTETIKSSLKDFSKEGKAVSLQQRDELIKTTSNESHTNPEAELEIYTIQKQKLEKLNKFKKFLEKTRTLDGGFQHETLNKFSDMSNKLPIVAVSSHDGEFFIRDAEGRESPVSIAEIMTDGEWGLQYTFDNSVNIHDIRKYYLEQLKADLREKLDKQIITSETAFTRGDSFKQDAYRAIEKRMEQGSEQGGVVAEKMVKNFLKKLVIETDADFEIVDADVYQDVEQKIDFIIHRRNNEKNRGAKITESDTATDIGIQFTMDTKKSKYKEEQVVSAKKRKGNDIDDIVLVTLPVAQASNLYKEWSKHQTSGGPEKSWDKQTQETIFRGVMNQVLSQQEINEFCERNFR